MPPWCWRPHEGGRGHRGGAGSRSLSPDHRVDLATDRISVKERINQLIDLLEEKNSITFDELFEGAVRKSDLIVTFLAILEMVKLFLKLHLHTK